MGKFFAILAVFVLVAVAFGAIGRASVPVVVVPTSDPQIVNANAVIAQAVDSGSVEVSDRTISEASTVQTLTDAQTEAMRIQAGVASDGFKAAEEIAKTGFGANVAIAATGSWANVAIVFLFVGGGAFILFLLWKVLQAAGNASKKSSDGGGNGN